MQELHTVSLFFTKGLPQHHDTLSCVMFFGVSKEFFSDKNDASLFVFGSHSKKRPSNLIVGEISVLCVASRCTLICNMCCSLFAGRMYDFHVLDMFELGIEVFKPISYFKVGQYITVNSKPPTLSTSVLMCKESLVACVPVYTQTSYYYSTTVSFCRSSVSEILIAEIISVDFIFLCKPYSPCAEFHSSLSSQWKICIL